MGLIIGCFYGPLIYVVLPLGGLYLTFDCLTFYVTFANSGRILILISPPGFGPVLIKFDQIDS